MYLFKVIMLTLLIYVFFSLDDSTLGTVLSLSFCIVSYYEGISVIDCGILQVSLLSHARTKFFLTLTPTLLFHTRTNQLISLLTLCFVNVLIQEVFQVPQTADQRWSATVKIRGPPHSPSSPSPSTTSSHPNHLNPSLCCPCSRATTLGCRPALALAPALAPAPALVLEVQ